jgi:hypothetical protein
LLAAVAIVAALLHHSSYDDASKIIYVIAPARTDFLRAVQSDPRYSMLRANPIGRSGRVGVSATGATKALAQKNLNTAIRSLEDWGCAWQKKRCSKEELAVINLAGAVQDYDPRDRPGRLSNALNHLHGFFRDNFPP